MPKAMSFISRVDDHGHLPEHRREQIATYLTLFAGGEVQIKIGKPTRTNRANRYYWSCVIGPIHEAMIDAGVGFMETNDGIKMVTAEILHDVFKQKYLPVRTAVVFGKDVTLPPTTTELDQTEFSDYIERIKTDPQVRQLSPHFPEPENTFRSYALSDLPY